jgi:hypothetical protein
MKSRRQQPLRLLMLLVPSQVRVNFVVGEEVLPG